MVESASEPAQLARVLHHVSNGVAWWHTKTRVLQHTYACSLHCESARGPSLHI